MQNLSKRYFDAMQESTGSLQIQVNDISIGMPLANVQVTVKNDNGDIVEELITDESGQTPIINLPAPPEEYSLESEQSVKPYATYNIETKIQGYRNVDVNGTQILSNSMALQQINTETGAQDAAPIVINIGPSTLWGNYDPKIPEDAVKPLNPPTGEIVLDEVVIPEYIVVHDGVPSDTSAANYYILFKDYIKNVACSEIYSTWPDATIRANVLAIISFALNRVFTEWYRNKGYNFTITSSTDKVYKWLNKEIKKEEPSHANSFIMFFNKFRFVIVSIVLFFKFIMLADTISISNFSFVKLSF